MKRTLAILFIASLACTFALAGNGAPPGADYNLQVIAYDMNHCPQGDFTDSNRHQIAVQANYHLYSCELDEYAACDPDAPDAACGDCIEIGECSNAEEPSCEADADCYEWSCTGGTCDGGPNVGLECGDDFDCNPGVYCGAGVLPSGKFADLNKTNTILLQPGDSFRVLDGNACGDDDGALFQLPATDVDCDFGQNSCINIVEGVGECEVGGLACEDDGDCGLCPAGPDEGEYCDAEELCGPATNFSVWIRLVGKPGTKIGVTLCAESLGECFDGLCDDGITACTTDADCNEGILCSLDNVIRMRTKGKSTFTDVTSELLTMTVCTDAPCDKKADYETVGIFDADFQNFFWNWNTKGKAHAQLKFYAD